MKGFAIFHKIGCHGNVPSYIAKRAVDISSAPETLSFGEKVTKIGPADPEIIVLRAKEKRKKLTQAKYIAQSAIVPSGLNRATMVMTVFQAERVVTCCDML